MDNWTCFVFPPLESRDTGHSANAYLNEMVIKLTVLLGCKIGNLKKRILKFSILCRTKSYKKFSFKFHQHYIRKTPLEQFRK